MGFLETELRGLAARATPVHERARVRMDPSVDRAAATDRRQRWLQLFSLDGDSNFLLRRLAFDGLDAETCLPLLGALRLAQDQAFPAWVTRFTGLLQHYGQRKAELSPTPFTSPVECQTSAEDTWIESIGDHASKRLPFWELWTPLVMAATEELRSRLDLSNDELPVSALRTFQWQLLATLSDIAGLTLGLEFQRVIAKHDPASAFSSYVPTAEQSPTRELYVGFINSLRDSALQTLFSQYPVLARLVSEVCGYWIDQVAEFSFRLREDRPAMAKLFHRGEDLGPLVAVKSGLSDPHQCHREVICCTFASGVSIVYKPRDLGVDEVFWAFLDWLNTRAQHQDFLRLRTLKVLNRTTHGWVEFVEHDSINDAAAAERYYRRLGMLLCLAYVTGGTDFHRENLVTSGEQPILLDLETLMQPQPRALDVLQANSADREAIQRLYDSVLRTGLLPFWITGGRGKTYDVSAIGADEMLDTGYVSPQWENINTDRMRLVFSKGNVNGNANVSRTAEGFASAQDHVTELVQGFSTMYQVLSELRNEVLAADGCLSALRGLKLRYLLRMTKAYSQVTRHRLHPEFLRDAADSSIELERLARDFVLIRPLKRSPAPWQVYEAELDALERLDIPLFTFSTDSTDLFADGKIAARDFFPETAMELLTRRLSNFCEEDLRKQTDLIRASMHIRYAQSTTDSAERETHHDNASDYAADAMSSEDLIAAAADIATQTCRLAIRGSDNSVTWISLAFDPLAGRMSFLPMLDTLYDGRLGVSFFLAALVHFTGSEDFRDLALEALLPLRKALRDPIPPIAGRSTLGGAMGLGGQIYALVRIADWLKDDEFLCLAHRAASWFNPKRIGLDDSLDILGGSAGGILGLLALWAADGRSCALDGAILCGNHLLSKMISLDSGGAAWNSGLLSRPLTGFAHGAAGIAYALLQLSQATGDLRFREAAESAIAFETSVYCERSHNWPDFRVLPGPQGHHFMVAWCNGAAGIGLARLGGLNILDGPSIRVDIANALQTTRRSLTGSSDDLCCGNFGRIELLIEAANQLAAPDLLNEARRQASRVVGKAAKNGQFELLASAPGVGGSLSLFQGTAGIGYELLRLAAPSEVPNVLLWK